MGDELAEQRPARRIASVVGPVRAGRCLARAAASAQGVQQLGVDHERTQIGEQAGVAAAGHRSVRHPSGSEAVIAHGVPGGHQVPSAWIFIDRDHRALAADGQDASWSSTARSAMASDSATRRPGRTPAATLSE